MKSFEQICKEVKDLEVKNALPVFQKTMIKFSKVIEQSYSVKIYFIIERSGIINA